MRPDLICVSWDSWDKSSIGVAIVASDNCAANTVHSGKAQSWQTRLDRHGLSVTAQQAALGQCLQHRFHIDSSANFRLKRLAEKQKLRAASRSIPPESYPITYPRRSRGVDRK